MSLEIDRETRAAIMREHTRAARQAFLATFEQQVDPDGTLDAEERARRAEHARRGHMASLARLSNRARRREEAASVA